MHGVMLTFAGICVLTVAGVAQQPAPAFANPTNRLI
jgi:hypothetical protein